MITLRFDGLFRTISPNNDPREVTGLMCYGWVIFRDGRLVAHGHGAFARPEWASSNSAEYLAMIEGLQALRDMGVQHEAVEVIGDARSVIEQMLGLAGVSSPQARPLYQRARRIARHFHNIRWIWQLCRVECPRRPAHPARLKNGELQPREHAPGSAAGG